MKNQGSISRLSRELDKYLKERKLLNQVIREVRKEIKDLEK
jgi:hypothetical protein